MNKARGEMKSLDRSTLLGLLAILLWSTTVALARSLTEQLGALTAATAVYLTGGVFHAGLLALKRGANRPWQMLSRSYLLFCGALFLIYTSALYLAMGLAHDHRQALELGLVNYLWPSFIVLLSLPILNKRANLLLAPGTVLALGGTFLVLTQGADISWRSFSANVAGNTLAYALAFVAAFAWALYSNLARRWGGPHNAGATPLFIMATGLALLCLRLLFPEESTYKLSTLLEVAWMSLVTVLAYACWDTSMRQGNATLVAAASYLTPFFSAVVSSLYLGIAPGESLWVGCALIVVGSFLSWLSVSDQSISESA